MSISTLGNHDSPTGTLGIPDRSTDTLESHDILGNHDILTGTLGSHDMSICKLRSIFQFNAMDRLSA